MRLWSVQTWVASQRTLARGWHDARSAHKNAFPCRVLYLLAFLARERLRRHQWYLALLVLELARRCYFLGTGRRTWRHYLSQNGSHRGQLLDHPRVCQH